MGGGGGGGGVCRSENWRLTPCEAWRFLRFLFISFPPLFFPSLFSFLSFYFPYYSSTLSSLLSFSIFSLQSTFLFISLPPSLPHYILFSIILFLSLFSRLFFWPCRLLTIVHLIASWTPCYLDFHTWKKNEEKSNMNNWRTTVEGNKREKWTKKRERTTIKKLNLLSAFLFYALSTFQHKKPKEKKVLDQGNKTYFSNYVMLFVMWDLTARFSNMKSFLSTSPPPHLVFHSFHSTSLTVPQLFRRFFPVLSSALFHAWWNE